MSTAAANTLSSSLHFVSWSHSDHDFFVVDSILCIVQTTSCFPSYLLHRGPPLTATLSAHFQLLSPKGNQETLGTSVNSIQKSWSVICNTTVKKSWTKDQRHWSKALIKGTDRRRPWFSRFIRQLLLRGLNFPCPRDDSCSTDADFHLMANCACRHLLCKVFDLPQAEPLDSCDSYCHPQSMGCIHSHQLQMKARGPPVPTHDQTKVSTKPRGAWCWSPNTREDMKEVPLSSPPTLKCLAELNTPITPWARDKFDTDLFLLHRLFSSLGGIETVAICTI